MGRYAPGRTIHMNLSVRGVLHQNNRDLERNFRRTIKGDDGRYVEGAHAIREWFMDQLAQGRELLPLGDCDDFDYKTGCRGHDSAELRRKRWLSGLKVGDRVRVAEYNGAPEERWLDRRIERVETIRLVDVDEQVVALWLDDGARFAQDDGRSLCIMDGRRVYFGMNEQLQPPAEVAGG
jgi:hypothetical protein